MLIHRERGRERKRKNEAIKRGCMEKQTSRIKVVLGCIKRNPIGHVREY